MAEAECRRASDAAEQAYVAAFREKVEPDEDAFEAEHRRALDAAAAAYEVRKTPAEMSVRLQTAMVRGDCR